MSCKKICTFQEQIASLFLSDVVLSSPTDQNSKFLPGNSLDNRTLQIRLSTKVAFPKNTILNLQLVSVMNSDGNFVDLCQPVCVEKKVETTDTSIVFEFKSCLIPLPKLVMFLPTVVKTCSTTIRFEAGNVIRYRFLFSYKLNKIAPLVCPLIPLDALVNSNAICDIKCERADIVPERDEQHTIKIYCEDTKSFVYSSLPHCVTHCQAPRPVIQYYVLENNVPYSNYIVCEQCGN